MSNKLVCPECGTKKVVVVEETSYMVNTHEYYCFSVKAHDDDAKARCLKCDWQGRRDQIKEVVTL